jgi:ribosome-binding protein aMBF1 (putative translation factor)
VSSPELRRRIAWRVKLLRTARQWPRAVLAAEAGVSLLIVDTVEAGEPVNETCLGMLARALGVKQIDLYSPAEWAVVKVLHAEHDNTPFGR